MAVCRYVKTELQSINHDHVFSANRPHPSSKTLPFDKTDPRLAFAVKTFDPRVHFALVFGAKVRLY